jgi:hypothetical protein
VTKIRNDPHGGGVETAGPLPPVTRDQPVLAEGGRLAGIDRLDERSVIEVRTADHGVLAVGLSPDGTPFAVSNLCRHQFAEARSRPRECSGLPRMSLAPRRIRRQIRGDASRPEGTNLRVQAVFGRNQGPRIRCEATQVRCRVARQIWLTG